MKILITTHSLARPGGTYVFVRDLSRALKQRHHAVVVFCAGGNVDPQWSRSASVPAITDIAMLPFRPDVIHLQHHDGMIALMALPNVPAVCHVHGANWLNAIVRHPRIYGYVVMSQTLAMRIATERSVPLALIDVLLNGVDLQRFARVRVPSERPRKAAVYNPLHDSKTVVGGRIAEAAARVGMELDFIGARAGRLVDDPESVLPCYDIVFASGKSAIDALACGCAVIVVGQTSCGELVGPANFERLRRANFSVPINAPRPSVERIRAEIEGYSAATCLAVSQRLRQEADNALVVDRLERAYAAAISRHASAAHESDIERRAAAIYLRRLAAPIGLAEARTAEAGSYARTTTAARRNAQAMIETLARRLSARN